jgi:cytochrome c-type biogenesis protein CcmF
MGTFIVYIAFFACFLSAILYLLVSRGNTKVIGAARLMFHVSVVMTISSAAYLLYLIITHQFQFTYVWNYSSKDLPVNLLASTFYAGQEGSFHLWAFMMAVLGVFLMSFLKSRDQDDHQKDHNGQISKDTNFEPLVMFTFAFIQSFLLFILIIKSPYLYVWESFPKEVAIGFVPEDGRGLNPLLQNFWMTIHPPILFAGFSSLAIPFCFAIAALVKNQYNRWLKLALPWTLFAGMVLGVGIMLGGFWAYGVLGWGGYWGWDPVENSSFVPWIVIVAAIHSMIAEEKTGKFKKTSLLLCVIAFVLVLYSTFLTRSGILGDASVHSFVDPGQEVYLFLVVFLSLFGGGGIALILFRMKSLGSDSKQASNLLSRESAVFIGAITLCATALVIAVGTSWPILAKGTIDPAFYNKMNLPLAIMIAAINGISILLAWKHTDEKRFYKSLYLPLIITGVVTAVLVAFAVRDVLIAIFVAASVFALIINANIAIKIFIKNNLKAGPYIAHLGIMILFLGIIGSSQYSEEVNLSLPLNETKSALGYDMTYKGATPFGNKDDKDEKYHFNVVVEKDGKGFLLQPVMFYSEYSDGIMKNPDIANLGIKDVYLAPMSLESPKPFNDEDVYLFKKGEEKEVKGLTIKFIDFDRSKFSQESMKTGAENTIGAEFEVTQGGKTETVIAEQHMHDGQTNNIPVRLKDSDHFTFMLSKINVASDMTAELIVVDETAPSVTAPETLVLTASIKPFINLVWGGTIIMALGFFASLSGRVKRFRQSQSTVNGSKDIVHNGTNGTNGINGTNGHKNGHDNGHNKVHDKSHKQKSH